MPGRTIVVAVDDSKISKDAVTWAAKKLINSEDNVHVISVLEPAQRPDILTAAESSYPVPEEEECKPDPIQLDRRCEMLKTMKKELTEMSGAKDVKLSTLVSCVGGSTDLARHICEYSAENKADLVVMGSRGMGSAQRALLTLFGLGSVSDFVVRHAPVASVLVHRGDNSTS